MNKKQKKLVKELIDGNRFDDDLQCDAWDLHTETNCQCGNPSYETYVLRSEGAGDIEMCLDCFGALECVY